VCVCGGGVLLSVLCVWCWGGGGISGGCFAPWDGWRSGLDGKLTQRGQGSAAAEAAAIWAAAAAGGGAGREQQDQEQQQQEQQEEGDWVGSFKLQSLVDGGGCGVWGVQDGGMGGGGGVSMSKKSVFS